MYFIEFVPTIFTIVVYFFSTCFIVIHLPMVIPESLTLRYYALNVAYLVGATYILSLYLWLLLFVSIEDAMSICTDLVGRWVVRMGWEIQNARNFDVLEKTGNAVIVVNHQSYFDPLPFISVWKQMAFSTKVYGGSELTNHVFLRKAAASQSHTFLDRGCKRTAMKTLMTSAEKHFKNDKQNKVLIFPEGERNMMMEDYKLLEFKRGAFRVAKNYNVPVIPMVISPLYFIDNQRHYFTKGKTLISVLEPIYPGDMEIDEFVAKVRAVMQEEFIRLKEELVDGKIPSASKNNTNEIDSIKKEL
uniref:1-acylglycerol-3-phosphate O-acyltransferase n=1 Tax=Lygus hesperus TaxID=30085 RepID=A0A0A9VXD1_LYGHE